MIQQSFANAAFAQLIDLWTKTYRDYISGKITAEEAMKIYHSAMISTAIVLNKIL